MCERERESKPMCVHVCVCVCTRGLVCMRVRECVCMCLCVVLVVVGCMFVYVHVYDCCVYIHTYIHSNARCVNFFFPRILILWRLSKYVCGRERERARERVCV